MICLPRSLRLFILDRLDVKRRKPEETLTKERLIEIVKGLLKTDLDLDFLQKMDQAELESLVACIRDRVDSIGK